MGTKKLNLGSILLSIVLMSGLISSIFKYNFNISNNANAFVLIVELILFVLVLVKNNGKIKLNIFIIYILIYIILEFFISRYFNLGVYSLAQLIVYSIIPLLAVSVDNIDSKKVMEICMMLSLLTIPCMKYLFSYQYEGYNQISMGNSYVICVPIVCSIIHYFLYYDKRRKQFNLLYFFNMFLFVRLIFMANRGAVLEIIITILLLYLSKFNKKSEIRKAYSISKKIRLAFIFVMIILIVINIKDLLGMLNSICISVFGQSPSFLTKSASLIESDNLNNHRSLLYETAFQLIAKKPFLGYGIETFSTYTKYPWPHNLFIQFLFEGGIILSIVPFFIIIKSVIKILESKFDSKDDYAMALLLSIMVFPRLLISNDIWLVPYLWCFLGYCSSFLSKKKKNIKDGRVE